MIKEIYKHPLVWWRDVPIDVEVGLLSYLSSVWNNTIYVVSANGYEEARKSCGWSFGTFHNVVFITGEAETQSSNTINTLIEDPYCLHIFSGVKGKHKKYLDKINNLAKAKCVFIMESTSNYGGIITKSLKSILYPIVYKRYALKYKKINRGLFAMGENAVIQYETYGWEKTLPFMYLPLLEDESYRNERKEKIRFLYIGRFDFDTKGLDVLMKAVEQLSDIPNEWELSLVGGYGSKAEEVINWCNNMDNVEFLGSWPSDEVIKKMRDYDCCIVPSRGDGWNLTPQQAIHAGVPCIVTDGAGSQEIITDSHAGLVIKKSDVVALRNALLQVIKSPDILEYWKTNATDFKNNISVSNVGKYFVDGLAYFFGFSEVKPDKTW